MKRVDITYTCDACGIVCEPAVGVTITQYDEPTTVTKELAIQKKKIYPHICDICNLKINGILVRRGSD